MSEHHILVIDDEDAFEFCFTAFLRKVVFVSQLLAMQMKRGKFAGIEFDLLVVDIMMPGEPARFLTDIREDNAVPALFLTAMSDAKYRRAEAGADDYIPKPFEPRN